VNEYTRHVGFDTIRLNWDIGSDMTVYRLPSEHEWYGENPLPLPRPSDPLQTQMQLKCLEVEAFGGGKRNLKNGDLLLWRRQDGVFYELRRSQYRNLLSIETSLPKLLYGHNRLPVSPAMLPDALEELTRRGRGFIGVDLPPCDELEAWRIDATADVRLNSEMEVALVGRALADFSLNGAMPVRYPSGGSVHWAASRGFPGARCYGKFEESGNDKAIGQYRSEVQVMGGKQFRKALEFAVANGDLSSEIVSGRGKRCVRAGTLATEKNLCTGLLGALNGILDGAIGLVRGVNDMTALEAIDKLQAKAGVSRSRAVQLVGYSHIVRVLGWGLTGLTPKGQWEARKHFEAAEVDPALIEFSSAEKIGAGVGMVAAGALIGASAVAGVVMGDALARAIDPDVPKAGRPGGSGNELVAATEVSEGSSTVASGARDGAAVGGASKV
jgi:hypothetical protein